MKNRLQFITSVDRLSDGGLRELAKLLVGPLQGLSEAVELERVVSGRQFCSSEKGALESEKPSEAGDEVDGADKAYDCDAL